MYFFEKKCVFGVDKWVEVGYIELAPGPQLACTARASKDVDGRGGAHFFCLNFPQVCKKASKERAFFFLILGASLWCILLYNSCRLRQKAELCCSQSRLRIAVAEGSEGIKDRGIKGMNGGGACSGVVTGCGVEWVVVWGVFWWGKLGEKCVFFEKKCVFGVDLLCRLV